MREYTPTELEHEITRTEHQIARAVAEAGTEGNWWKRGYRDQEIKDLRKRLADLNAYDPAAYAAKEQLRASRIPEPLFSAPGEQLAEWLSKNRAARAERIKREQLYKATRGIEYTP